MLKSSAKDIILTKQFIFANILNANIVFEGNGVVSLVPLHACVNKIKESSGS